MGWWLILSRRSRIIWRWFVCIARDGHTCILWRRLIRSTVHACCGWSNGASWAIFNARSPAAVASVPITLRFIVFVVASAISNPNQYTTDFFVRDWLLDQNLWVGLAIIVTVVYNYWLRKHIVWENFSTWPPSVPESFTNQSQTHKDHKWVPHFN